MKIHGVFFLAIELAKITLRLIDKICVYNRINFKVLNPVFCSQDLSFLTKCQIHISPLYFIYVSS